MVHAFVIEVSFFMYFLCFLVRAVCVFLFWSMYIYQAKLVSHYLIHGCYLQDIIWLAVL